ncbi:MAG TPA: SpoIIE family protein phosphatase [Acidimicrobiales bacterium]|nr:SpoIIE family protein phosphatase [Acidimicrobiales bacterium]
MLDAVADAVLVLDPDDVVTYANDAAVTLLARPADVLVGSHLADLAAPGPAAPLPLEPIGEGLPEERPVADVWVLPDGTPIPVEVLSAPLLGPGGQEGIVLTLRPAIVRDGSLYEIELLRLTASEQAQRTNVHQLQEAVQPPQPEVDGVELGVHYLSADRSAPTGGDLYDWQVLPDGDLHLLVVDVIGKGVAATKDALAVVHVLRVLVLEGFPMDRLVERADDLLARTNRDLVATVLVGRYTPATGRLVLAGGGHPPLLVVRSDGEVEEVAAPGIPLGWPGAGSFKLTEVHLGRSETAVLYTDGLIEARRDILAGIADLKTAAAETSGYPARHLPRVLIERALAGAQRHDDSLALVVRRRCPPPPDGTRLLGPFEHRFTPHLVSVPVARSLFGDWLRHQGLDEATVADQLLVASELCTNAVCFATGSVGSITLRGEARGTDLVVEVADDGGGFTQELTRFAELPTPEQLTGRGLFIVDAMVDELIVNQSWDRTVVSATRHAVFPEESE